VLRLCVAATLGSVLLFNTGGRAGAAAYRQVGLAAKVDGANVTVWTKVSANPQAAVGQYGVCVHSSTGAYLDFPKVRNVVLTTAGTEYYWAAKTFAPGTYSYYACTQGMSSSIRVGPSSTFTVTRSLSTGVSGAMPAVPPGYTRQVGEDFSRPAALGKFKAVYGSDWAGYGGNSTTVATTARDNGRYRPDKVLSARGGVVGASDSHALDFYLHSERLADDDVAGPTAVTAAPLPLGWRGLTCGRFSLRYRADTITGYKQAHLLWPETANWNDGEIDFPENEEFGTTPYWAVHIPGTYQTPYAGRLVRDQAGGLERGTVPVISEDHWHVATIDLKPGSVKFEWDGKVVGAATGIGENGVAYRNKGVPTKPMVFVLQTETSPWDTGNPSQLAAGHEQIDWVTIDAC